MKRTKRENAEVWCYNLARALPEVLTHLSVQERQDFFRLAAAVYCPTCGRKRVKPDVA